MKCCVKLGKTATETLQLLRDAYCDEALSRARVFGWHMRFVLSMEDDTRSGRPSSSRNEDNVVRIRDMILISQLLTVCDVMNFDNVSRHVQFNVQYGSRKEFWLSSSILDPRYMATI